MFQWVWTSGQGNEMWKAKVSVLHNLQSYLIVVQTLKQFIVNTAFVSRREIAAPECWRPCLPGTGRWCPAAWAALVCLASIVRVLVCCVLCAVYKTRLMSSSGMVQWSEPHAPYSHQSCGVFISCQSCFIESWSSSSWKQPFKGCLVQNPCNEQRHLQLDQVV